MASDKMLSFETFQLLLAELVPHCDPNNVDLVSTEVVPLEKYINHDVAEIRIRFKVVVSRRLQDLLRGPDRGD